MRWSRRIIGPGVFDGSVEFALAAHSALDGSLHLIVRRDDGNLRELWWTDTTGGAGDLTGHGVPPTVPQVESQYVPSAASYVTADGRQHVVYVTDDRQLWELYWLGDEAVQGGDLLARASAPHPNPALSAYVWDRDGSQHVIYRDQQRRVIELQWSGNGVPTARVAGGDTDHGFPADSMPICSHLYAFDLTQHAFYLSGGEIIELRKAIGEDWQARNLTRISSGAPPLAVSGPSSHVAADGTQHVFSVAATGEIFELWWMGDDTPQAENLTAQAKAPPGIIFRFDGGPKTSPPVATHFVPSEATQHVFFSDQSGTPWEIWWHGSEPKTPENLTARAGAPRTNAASPFRNLVAADGSQHVAILTNDNVFMDLVARP